MHDETILIEALSGSKLTNWSYNQIDSSATIHVALRGTTALPALVVWVCLASNATLQQPWTDAQIELVVNATGMTAGCVQYLVETLTDRDVLDKDGEVVYTNEQVQDAFEIVAAAFHGIGAGFPKETFPDTPRHHNGREGDPYVPYNCPTPEDMGRLFDAAGASF